MKQFARSTGRRPIRQPRARARRAGLVEGLVDALAQILACLKCGTYLPASATVSPVFGLRPCRGAGMQTEAAEPRISMRCPGPGIAHDLEHLLHASSTSLAGRWLCFAAMSSMSSDFVMLRSPSLRISRGLPHHASGAVSSGGHSARRRRRRRILSY